VLFIYRISLTTIALIFFIVYGCNDANRDIVPEDEERTFYRTGEEIAVCSGSTVGIGKLDANDDDGKVIEGHLIFVLRHENDEWLIHRNMYNKDWRREEG